MNRRYGNGHPPAMHIPGETHTQQDRKSTRLNSSHQIISYAVFCLKKKKKVNKQKIKTSTRVDIRWVKKTTNVKYQDKRKLRMLLILTQHCNLIATSHILIYPTVTHFDL